MEENLLQVPVGEEVNSSFTDKQLEQIETILSKYFDTKEEKLIKEKEKNKALEEEKKILEKEKKDSEKTSVEFQEQLLQSVENIGVNSQFGNNLIYVGIVVSLVIVITTVFYKFLKYFV